MDDLCASKVDRAVVENSANMFLLGQKAETISSLASSGRLPLSPFGVSLLRNVNTKVGRCSEIDCHTGAGAGVGRLVVSPFVQLLYATLPAETADIDCYRKDGLSITKAINAVLKNWQNSSVVEAA